jgi:hypothetical protein
MDDWVGIEVHKSTVIVVTCMGIYLFALCTGSDLNLFGVHHSTKTNNLENII